jgi:hypothetical protein
MKIIGLRKIKKDPFYLLALIELCAIIDALVFLVSFGNVVSNLRVYLLFSEWADSKSKHN